MSPLHATRINARTIVLDAAHQHAAPLRAELTPHPCATPTCPNVVEDWWEESGRLCGHCAIEEDLYDREARRQRSFPAAVF